MTASSTSSCGSSSSCWRFRPFSRACSPSFFADFVEQAREGKRDEQHVVFRVFLALAGLWSAGVIGFLGISMPALGLLRRTRHRHGGGCHHGAGLDGGPVQAIGASTHERARPQDRALCVLWPDHLDVRHLHGAGAGQDHHRGRQGLSTSSAARRMACEKALVSTDAAYYKLCHDYLKPGDRPLERADAHRTGLPL